MDNFNPLENGSPGTSASSDTNFFNHSFQDDIVDENLIDGSFLSSLKDLANAKSNNYLGHNNSDKLLDDDVSIDKANSLCDKIDEDELLKDDDDETRKISNRNLLQDVCTSYENKLNTANPDDVSEDDLSENDQNDMTTDDLDEDRLLADNDDDVENVAVNKIFDKLENIHSAHLTIDSEISSTPLEDPLNEQADVLLESANDLQSVKLATKSIGDVDETSNDELHSTESASLADEGKCEAVLSVDDSTETKSNTNIESCELFVDPDTSLVEKSQNMETTEISVDSENMTVDNSIHSLINSTENNGKELNSLNSFPDTDDSTASSCNKNNIDESNISSTNSSCVLNAETTSKDSNLLSKNVALNGGESVSMESESESSDNDNLTPTVVDTAQVNDVLLGVVENSVDTVTKLSKNIHSDDSNPTVNENSSNLKISAETTEVNVEQTDVSDPDKHVETNFCEVSCAPNENTVHRNNDTRINKKNLTNGPSPEPMETDENMEIGFNKNGNEVTEVVPEIALYRDSADVDLTADKNDACLLNGSDTGEISKGAEEENCIIPDTVEMKLLKGKAPKAVRPVRLEKLMDPEKITGSPEQDQETKSTRPQRKAAKKAETQIKEMVALSTSLKTFRALEDIELLPEVVPAVCFRCNRLKGCRYIGSSNSRTVHICEESCLDAEASIISSSNNSASIPPQLVPVKTPALLVPKSVYFRRRCAQCNLQNIVDEKSLSWEAMDFCNEDCLSRYQTRRGSYCTHCTRSVQHASMGKYAVRFGLDVKQFCTGNCLEEFKKRLKSCGYCQKNITNATKGIVTAVVDRGQNKDFCGTECLELFQRMASNAGPKPEVAFCTVCTSRKEVAAQVLQSFKTYKLCSETCLRAFKFANDISNTDQCHICKKYYTADTGESSFVYHDDEPLTFCSRICTNVFIMFRRKIIPCSWCKVKKYNFDMIKKLIPGGMPLTMCSLNCLTLYQVSINATSTRQVNCDFCGNSSFANYHLTMSDATIRNFCSYNCVMAYQKKYHKTPLMVPSQEPNTRADNEMVKPTVNDVAGPTATTTVSKSDAYTYIQQIVTKPAAPTSVANKQTQCMPAMCSIGVGSPVETESKDTMTDEYLKYPAVLPIPVPLYVPTPLHMYCAPYPVLVPFPVPVPFPVFIPTTRNTYKGVIQQLKEIQTKTPTDPLEADLLMMAQMVASEENIDQGEVETRNDDIASHNSDSDSDRDYDDEVTAYSHAGGDLSDDEYSRREPSSGSSNGSAGAEGEEDVLQLALKMANEQLNSNTVDLEDELTSNTITPQSQPADDGGGSIADTDLEDSPPTSKSRSRKRSMRSPSEGSQRKRSRQPFNPATNLVGVAAISTPVDMPAVNSPTPPTVGPRSNSPASAALTNALSNDVTQRPDINMYLKYSIGIRAWNQWIISKNEEVERVAAASNRRAKVFNPNILKLTTDELNFLLCKFVREIRKPDGSEYAPDTIFYLCLSIQQYLFQNGRIDNIFTDTFYEPFTDILDEVASKFSQVNDATQYIVTRVEEEHLWESKQLGAHSPHVLLCTLMFFNTKFFNLATLEEHMQLSFSHIMKHWKRNPNAPLGAASSPKASAPNRNVVLRFYPPQAALDAPNSRKKKVYEQHENESNPLRCPVKLYEFYLSKCPESVKQRNDVFYLQPERSCVPDSPVWYSTMPLQKELLMKMLHRIRMVKEVNISLLAT